MISTVDQENLELKSLLNIKTLVDIRKFYGKCKGLYLADC